MNLDTQTDADIQKLRLELRLKQLEKVETCHNEFLPFVRAMWPEFIAGTTPSFDRREARKDRGRVFKTLDHQHATATHEV